MKDSYDVCMKLLRAESEEEVLKIIGKTPEMQDEDNWRYLGDNSQNNSLISSQSSASIKALTELMTNMVDAILLKNADENNQDKRAPDAPDGVQEAINKWIHPIKGRLSQLGTKDAWVRKFSASNLVVAISGPSTQTPCFTFIDTGEGQSPEDFPQTFMSLPTTDDSEGRKDAIKFVQGKHNMGSSGVLRFAGQSRLKLIISRRFNKTGNWGWTITRKEPNPEHSVPRTQYFFPKDEDVVGSFSADYLLPLRNKYGEEFEGLKLEAGSIVKLYDYRVGRNSASQLRWHRPFYENMTDTMLPFRFLDCRINKAEKGKAKDELRQFGVDARIFCGLESGAVDYSSNDFDEYFDDGFKDSDRMIDLGRATNPKLGTISFRCILLNAEIPEWLRETSHRIFHSVNGQVHYKQTRGEISRCGYKAIENQLLINVDASNLSDEAHTEVWQGNREDVAETMHGDLYKELVHDFLSKSEQLGKLNKLVREKRITELKSEGRKNIIENLLKNSPQMRFLLGNEHPIIDSLGDETISEETEVSNYTGEHSPSFFHLKNKNKKLYGVRANRPRIIIMETDVVNDYFTRSENQGELLIPHEISKNFQIYDYLEDGELRLYVKALPHVTQGQKFEAKFGVKDDAMKNFSELWTDKIELEIIKPVENDDDDDDDEEDEEPPKKSATYDEPNFVLLVEKKNDDKIAFLEQEFGVKVEVFPSGFTTQDGGYSEDLGDGHIDYFINYDNIYHLNLRRQQPEETDKRLISQRYVYSMLLMMMGFENAIKNTEIPEFKEDQEFRPDELFRRMAAQGASSAVLVISESISDSISLKESQVED